MMEAPQGSFVLSAAGQAVVKQSQDGLKVTLDVQGLTLFLTPSDATLIGAQLVTVASTINAELPF